jgi:hypothetical protein
MVRSQPFHLMEDAECRAALRTMQTRLFPSGQTKAEHEVAARDFAELVQVMGIKHLLAFGAGDADLQSLVLATHRDDGATWLMWTPKAPKGQPRVLFAVPCTREGVEHVTSPDFPAKLERARQATRNAKGRLWNALELDEQALTVLLARTEGKQRAAVATTIKRYVEIRDALEPLGSMPEEVESLIDESRAPDEATLQEIIRAKQERAQFARELAERKVRQQRDQQHAATMAEWERKGGDPATMPTSLVREVR